MYRSYISLIFYCVTLVLARSESDAPLNLTPLIENGELAKARNLSSVDPTHFVGVKSHSAFINVNNTQKWNLFFWYFPIVDKPVEETPWIIWLQGGPGASSLFGLFLEIGPIQVVNDKAEKMPITWASDYSLLFIDNPVGAGFSYTGSPNYVTTEDEVGACLLSFIQQFLQVFPELRKAPLFIAGESYAGKYIPTFGHYIHHNKNNSMPINLKGLAIGNGWTDPPTLTYYSDMLEQTGLVDTNQAQKIRKNEEIIRDYWKKGDTENYNQNFDKLSRLPIGTIDIYNYKKDFRKIDDHYVKFLTSKPIREALHVGDTLYYNVNRDAYFHLSADKYLTVKPWLEELLEHYGVMGYSGQLDIIVGYALSIHTYATLNWSGSQAYLAAERMPLFDPESGNVVGYIREAANFVDAMVRDAGHMVPYDQPRAAKLLIDTFINKFK